MLEFGPLLRVCRSLWGLTQVEMAELLCISQPVYSRVEAGKKPVSLKTLQRVADRAGMTIQTLILAHLLLDDNLDAIEKGPRDGATKSLLRLAEDHRLHAPAGVRDGVALGLLLDSASE